MRTPWIWRAALRLLPPEFRARHEDDIGRVIEWHLEGKGAIGRPAVWARAVADTVVAAVRMRRAARRLDRAEGMTMDRVFQDVGFAVRALQRRPGFTVLAVLTLAVGIGANTAIFSVVNGVLLRPLPYLAADRIGILWHEFGDGAQKLPAVHPLDVRDYRDRSELFETFTMATGREMILGESTDPEVVDVGLVEAGFFEFFGTAAEHGRTFTPEEDVAGAVPAAVLSHRLWVRRFGADPAVVGSAVPLAGGTIDVVGVLPEDFRLRLPSEAFLLRDAELWLSLRLDPARTPPRNFTGFTGFGRLEEGVTFAQAQSEVESLAARLKEEHPEHAASKLVARIEPLQADIVKGADRTILLLFGAVGFVLLIACANVANLVMVRGQSRSAELALRSALGAGKAGLARLVLVESALLATAGSVLGLLLAWGGIEVLTTLGQGSVPLLDAVRLDGPVLAFAAGAGALAAALFGLVPALSAAGRDPAAELHGAGRGGESRRRQRVRNALIVVEVAASLVLMVGTGLMIRTVMALGEVDPGFAMEGAMTFRTNLPIGSFPDGESRRVAQQELIEGLEALPGVRRAAVVSQLPLTGSGPLQPYAYDEETATNWESVTADQRWISPGFFDAIGARLVEGRTFTGQGEVDGGTIVIDDRLAQRAFPGRSAVGERLQVNPNDAPEEVRYASVVGVVEHLRLHDLSQPHLTQIWFAQTAGIRFSMVVRTDGDPEALAPEIRTLMGRLAPGAPVEDMRGLDQLASASLAPERLTLALMTGFGVVALLLASVGIYGVLSFAVSQRTREIGVRMALGQAPEAARRRVLSQGARLVAVALVLGLGAAVFLSRTAADLLYGVEPVDPITYLITSAVLGGVAMLACWVPAVRATRVDPVTALKG